jgi:acyl-CoA thioesterase-1
MPAAVLAVSVARAALADERPIRILALGDSLTAGYGLSHEDGFVTQMQAALDAHHAGVVLLDGGVSGDTSRDALERLDWVLGGPADRPDAALVELGGNDGLRGLDPATMGRQIGAILDRLAALHIPVLLSGMFAPPNMGAQYATHFRAAFAPLAARPGLLWDPFFLDGVAGRPALQQADRIHPNAQGVRVIVNRLLPRLLELAAVARAAHAGTVASAP